MIQLYIRLILIWTAMHLGMSFYELSTCQSVEFRNKIERASREVLKIDWRPISIFPEEARRFR